MNYLACLLPILGALCLLGWAGRLDLLVVLLPLSLVLALLMSCPRRRQSITNIANRKEVA